MVRKKPQYDYGNIIILSDNVSHHEVNKILIFVSQANGIINQYFDTESNFDLIICKGDLQMQTQIISKIRGNEIVQWQQQKNNNRWQMSKSVALIDYLQRKIVIRNDIAKFGHYLLEFILSILDRSHTHQLREALAWYYTMKLTERFKYVRPPSPMWIDYFYVTPIKRLGNIVGDDFLKDLALGKASIEVSAFPMDIKKLFMPEEMFYC
jgi:hypothetical protein